MMEILRDDDLIAVNDVIVACREASARLDTAADLLERQSLAGALAQLASERSATAETLAEAVIARNEVPNAPSDEKTLVEAAVTRVKTVLSQDETGQLLADCKAKEQAVAEAAATALQTDLEPAVRTIVAALESDATTRLQGLIDAEGG